MPFICGVLSRVVLVFVGATIGDVGLTVVWDRLLQGFGIDSNAGGALVITKGDARQFSLWEEGIAGSSETGMLLVD